MQEVATEDRLPAHGCPKRCLPSGPGRPRKFLCARRGTSGQHLDGRPAQNWRLESRQQLRPHLSILVWHLNWLLLVPTGKYLMTFTEFGCIPISTAYQTSEFGWAVTKWVQIWVLSSISAPPTHTDTHLRFTPFHSSFSSSSASSTTSLGSLTRVSSTRPASAQKRTPSSTPRRSPEISSVCSKHWPEGTPASFVSYFKQSIHLSLLYHFSLNRVMTSFKNMVLWV